MRLCMTSVWRVLLWILVVVAPGGVLLLPILAADALKRRGASVPALAERVSLLPERASLLPVAVAMKPHGEAVMPHASA